MKLPAPWSGELHLAPASLGRAWGGGLGPGVKRSVSWVLNLDLYSSRLEGKRAASGNLSRSSHSSRVMGKELRKCERRF